MKQQEKNALSRQRILDAALEEFSRKGYDGASLNAACAGHNISKGILYHYFKDKDTLYLTCVRMCFDAVVSYLDEAVRNLSGTVEERTRGYFDARLRFFGEHPLYLGIFADVVKKPPGNLGGEISECRREFDRRSVEVLTALLSTVPLREGMTVEAIVEDFRMYMDYFNMRFRSFYNSEEPDTALKKHEERCHRQLDILLHGVIGEEHGKK